MNPWTANENADNAHIQKKENERNLALIKAGRRVDAYKNNFHFTRTFITYCIASQADMARNKDINPDNSKAYSTLHARH